MYKGKEFNIKILSINWILSFLVILFLIFFYNWYDFKGSSIFVVVTFFINIIYAVKKLIWDTTQPFSFNAVFWFFNLLFLGITPLFQYTVQWFKLRNLVINDTSVIELNLLILLYMLVFSIVYKFSYKNMNKAYMVEIKETKRSTSFLYFLLLLFILFINMYIIGPENMFLRSTRTVGESGGEEVSLLRIILEASLFSACLLLLLNIDYSRTKHYVFKWAVYIFSFLYLLTLIFPTSRARFLIGAIYLGTFLYVRSNTANKKILIIFLIVGFLFVMPILSDIRNVTNAGELLTSFSLDIDYEYFIKGDFSPYAIALATIEYVKIEGLMYGRQMLSNLLFFVPRNIWPEKEYSLGYTIADYYDHVINNMASPLVIEFFVDFGVAGLIIFTAVMALISGRLDRLYWSLAKMDRKYLFNYIYPYVVLIFLFINRGAFMSTFSRLVYLLMGFMMVAPFCFKGFTLLKLNKKSKVKSKQKKLHVSYDGMDKASQKEVESY
ncbi:O-antigen polymerase [Thalassobacillus devorans]|uniref:O-antigen polymerase n=1 Tax=Thalassobacillus devorans TaxID=279813 RepID=UPI00048EAD03|nr:O-antigen polymerase [Thalassobacillus devorans]